MGSARSKVPATSLRIALGCQDIAENGDCRPGLEKNSPSSVAMLGCLSFRDASDRPIKADRFKLKPISAGRQMNRLQRNFDVVDALSTNRGAMTPICPGGDAQ